MDHSLGNNNNNNQHYSRPYQRPPQTAHPIINTSKQHTRDLTMCIAADRESILPIFEKIRKMYSHQDNIIFETKLMEDKTVTGRVSWECEKVPFGFEVQILKSDQVLLQETLKNTELVTGNKSVFYIIEGSGVNVPVAERVKCTAPHPSRMTMWVAAGEKPLLDELIKIAEQIYPGESQNIVKTCGLFCGGDVNWTWNETGEQIGPIVERKGKDDFVKSIVDDRVIQKHVMLANAPRNSLVMYVIEGNILSTRSAIDPKAKMGSMVNKPLRDGVSVINVQTTADTAAMLFNIHLQMEWMSEKNLREAHVFHGKELNRGVTKNLYAAGDPRNRLAVWLCRITGISNEMAQAVTDKYDSLSSLVTALASSNDPVSLLSVIRVERIDEKTAQKTLKPLGIAAAKSIVEWLDLERLVAGVKGAVSCDDDSNEVEEVVQKAKKRKPNNSKSGNGSN